MQSEPENPLCEQETMLSLPFTKSKMDDVSCNKGQKAKEGSPKLVEGAAFFEGNGYLKVGAHG